MSPETSLLFPRLPRAVAQREYERLKPLPLATVADEWNTSHPDAVVTPIGGTEIPEEALRKLRREIAEAASDAGFPDESTGAKRAAFDLNAAQILTREMTIVPAEAIDADLWSFIGVVLLPDVTFWRFENRPPDRILGTDLTRHTFGRLWWRAYQLHDLRPGSGLSALSAISESKMNQLFERRNIGGNRVLVRAIGRVLTDLDPTWEDLADRDLVRDAHKRIQRLLPFISFESIDEDALELIVRDTFAAAASQLRTTDTESPDQELVDASAQSTSSADPPPVPAPQTMTGRHTDADAGAGVHRFDELPLAGIAEQVARLVKELGGVTDDDLDAQFCRRYGVELRDGEPDILRRFAWSASGHGFITRDPDNGLWLPGETEPTPSDDYGDWTFASIRERAAAHFAQFPNEDPYERLLAEVCPKEKPPVLVRRIVGKAVASVRPKKPRRRGAG